MPYRLYLPQIEKAAPPPDKALEIFRLARDHPGQQRDRCVWHPVLAKVAKAKAQDMADKHYFDHVDRNGKGTNWWVKRAGYRLPDWYHQHDAASNVESINRVTGGEGHAIDVWNVWMNSPGHRTHILGESDFFRDQTNIGIGVATTVEDGKPVHYWSFISCPPE